MYIDMILAVMGTFFLYTHLCCLVGCLSMIVWTHAGFFWGGGGLRLICMCFVFLYLHLFRAIKYVSHGKAL